MRGRRVVGVAAVACERREGEYVCLCRDRERERAERQREKRAENVCCVEEPLLTFQYLCLYSLSE